MSLLPKFYCESGILSYLFLYKVLKPYMKTYMNLDNDQKAQKDCSHMRNKILDLRHDFK